MERNLSESHHTSGGDASASRPLWKRPQRRLSYVVTPDGHQLLCYRPSGAVAWQWAFRAKGDGNPNREVTEEGLTWSQDRAETLAERALERERGRKVRRG